MPIYLYRCGCAHEFEVLEPFNPDSDTRTCPQCMEQSAKRQIAPAEFRIEVGGGHYKKKMTGKP